MAPARSGNVKGHGKPGLADAVHPLRLERTWHQGRPKAALARELRQRKAQDTVRSISIGSNCWLPLSPSAPDEIWNSL